jgi:cupin superfamily acireductone dioxygenase involved in methionine salvage
MGLLDGLLGNASEIEVPKIQGEFELSTVDADLKALSTVRATAGDTVSIPSMVWHNFKIGSILMTHAVV